MPDHSLPSHALPNSRSPGRFILLSCAHTEADIDAVLDAADAGLRHVAP